MVHGRGGGASSVHKGWKLLDMEVHFASASVSIVSGRDRRCCKADI